MIREKVGTLYDWAREGHKPTRLKFIRELGNPTDVAIPDEEPLNPEELQKQVKYEIVRTLVSYAAGKQQDNKAQSYFFPFGALGGPATVGFKGAPSAWFALALAEMYPYLSKEKSTWDENLVAKFNHPVTGLWPWRAVKRHLSFQTKFRSSRIDMFAKYEASGGTFFGSNVAVARKRRHASKKKKRAKPISSDDEEDSFE